MNFNRATRTTAQRVTFADAKRMNAHLREHGKYGPGKKRRPTFAERFHRLLDVCGVK